jgi:hypothetical protein
MDAKQAKLTAKAWVEANLARWPGLRAAHLVGGITSMADGAPLPAHKDVDLHLIFVEGSPALRPAGPFANLIEAPYGGVAIGAGIRPLAEYRSAEAVLANPEIAYHLTFDSTLHDPDGLLRGLRDAVEREYRRRRWVLARLQHERDGLAGAFALRPGMAAAYGASGEFNVLCYAMTYAAAALQVATLSPPRVGGRALLHLRDALAAADRVDLYEEVLATLGLTNVDLGRVEGIIREGAEAFDLAVAVRRTPHPFQHKLQCHLRPYFVESCREMLAEDHHREVLGWATSLYLITTDVILADGPAATKPLYAARRARLLAELGLDTADARATAFARAASTTGSSRWRTAS